MGHAKTPAKGGLPLCTPWLRAQNGGAIRVHLATCLSVTLTLLATPSPLQLGKGSSGTPEDTLRPRPFDFATLAQRKHRG